MAMIDYGAVVFKNGRLKNEGEFFMDMKDAVGWSDASAEGDGEINDNYFAYVGDEHMTVAIYKGHLVVLVDRSTALELHGMTSDGRWGTRMVRRFSVGGVNFCLRRVYKDAYIFWLQFTYKGDHYNVMYGYGIDPTPRIWNREKVNYLGRRLSKRVDRLYQRFKSTSTMV